MADKLTKEEKLAKLGNIDQEIERLRKEAEPLRKDLGGEGSEGGGVATEGELIYKNRAVQIP
jgi:hypothetical protein